MEIDSFRAPQKQQPNKTLTFSLRSESRVYDLALSSASSLHRHLSISVQSVVVTAVLSSDTTAAAAEASACSDVKMDALFFGRFGDVEV